MGKLAEIKKAKFKNLLLDEVYFKEDVKNNI
jgi:hypothetical protein